jgi:arginase family enzyme
VNLPGKPDAGNPHVRFEEGGPGFTAWPLLYRLAREGRRLTVLQFDAHSDLRIEYEGSPYSHAAVMARTVDEVDITAVGIRALTREERQMIRERDSITTIFAEEMWENDAWIDRAMAALGDDVFITFDVDYFDPSLIPATGTPEPGGPGWYPTLKLLRRVFDERNVVGADVVELAPMGGNAAPDFAIAKLVYKMVGYHWASRRRLRQGVSLAFALSHGTGRAPGPDGRVGRMTPAGGRSGIAATGRRRRQRRG